MHLYKLNTIYSFLFLFGSIWTIIFFIILVLIIVIIIIRCLGLILIILLSLIILFRWIWIVRLIWGILLWIRWTRLCIRSRRIIDLFLILLNFRWCICFILIVFCFIIRSSINSIIFFLGWFFWYLWFLSCIYLKSIIIPKYLWCINLSLWLVLLLLWPIIYYFLINRLLRFFLWRYFSSLIIGWWIIVIYICILICISIWICNCILICIGIGICVCSCLYRYQIKGHIFCFFFYWCIRFSYIIFRSSHHSLILFILKSDIRFPLIILNIWLGYLILLLIIILQILIVTILIDL